MTNTQPAETPWKPPVDNSDPTKHEFLVDAVLSRNGGLKLEVLCSICGETGQRDLEGGYEQELIELVRLEREHQESIGERTYEADPDLQHDERAEGLHD